MFTKSQALTAASIVRGFYEGHANHFYPDLEGADRELNEQLLEISTAVDAQFDDLALASLHIDFDKAAENVGYWLYTKYDEDGNLPDPENAAAEAWLIAQNMNED